MHKNIIVNLILIFNVSVHHYSSDLPKAVQSQSMQFADDLTVSEQGRDI